MTQLSFKPHLPRPLVTHKSAKASHYSKGAEHYDAFNEKKSQPLNQLLASLLKKYKVKSVLDMTCGTGSQVFWLAKHGFNVVGTDINPAMLKIAKEKTQTFNRPVRFLKGDMRTFKTGPVDAVITFFNAVGHLTKADFEKAMRTIHHNLKPGGLYIFDIFNLGYLLKDNTITTLTIDWQEKQGATTLRDIQYSTINKEGILASYTTSYVQEGKAAPTISLHAQTLQVYTASQLKTMLQRNGFKVLTQSAIDGSTLHETKSERILTIARKV
jgi:ubiquinone/menaquinone biosynthesis C-methylase UbiE